MYSFDDYISNKSGLIHRMEETKSNIAELESMGIDVSESIKKIDKAIQIVSDDKISIVLVGAFSDGKTSVAAGWMNEKLENMKISSDESSDEILCYTPSTIPDGCVIVDTPGLFGDKKGADEEGTIISLSDMTRKYISEANLILYVVTAKNPIKDSHKECIKWILKDLNKLSTTIFVINRMDDVSDLTDDEDFAQQERIKTENLRGKLIECKLTRSESERANVVCISAAPYGKGIDEWSNYREEYLQRSHLGKLEIMTNSILQHSRDSLIIKTGCDILNDEINKMLDMICEQEKDIIEYILPEKKEGLKRNKKDLESLKKRILRTKIDMKKALKALNSRKISKIRAASMEDFATIVEDEIGMVKGKEGYVLQDEINDIFKEYAEKNSELVVSLGEKIQQDYDKQNDFINKMLKKGVDGAALGLKSAGQLGIGTLKSGIFAGRDLLGKVGIVIKFKPWDVTKLANFASKAFPIIGAAIDMGTNIAENLIAQKKNKEFEKTKKELQEAVESIFYDVYDKLNSDEDYISQFAPQYRALEEQIKQDEIDIKELEENLRRFDTWKRHNANIGFVT